VPLAAHSTSSNGDGAACTKDLIQDVSASADLSGPSGDRSAHGKTPDGIRQEIYQDFLTHYAVRALMYEAADQAQIDPDRLSVVRRRVVAQALFSPH